MFPQSPFYGTLESFSDSLPVDDNPWLELYQLAERAGVTVEYLCTTVEIAALHANEGKSASTSFAAPLYGDDLEEVARILADDEFELKAKEWRESEHPRDERGRFAFAAAAVAAPGQVQSVISLHVSPTRAEVARTKHDMRNLHKLVHKQCPGLKSRWKRHLRIKHFTTLKALGTKDWTCTISIAYETVKLPAYRVGTLLHETFHAFSPTTQEQYKSAPGWEEATIECLTQLHQQNFAEQMGLSITKEEFDERNKDNAYPPLVRSLEALRIGLKAQDKEKFYNTLLKIPATQRKQFIESEGRKLTDSDATLFKAAFRIHARRLDEYSRDNTQQIQTKTVHTDAMTQEDVIEAILSARTPEQITRARQMRDTWMQDHPRDFKVMSGSEMLEMLAEAHGMKNQDLDKLPGILINCDTDEDVIV